MRTLRQSAVVHLGVGPRRDLPGVQGSLRPVASPAACVVRHRLSFRLGAAALLLSLAWGSIGAAELAIDQPDAWWEPSASHHGKHFLGGLAVGAGSYALTSLGPVPVGDRFITAAAAGAIVGVGFEVIRGWDGSAYIDPCDAAWVVLGSVAGAGLAHLTGQAMSVRASPDVVAVGIAFRF